MPFSEVARRSRSVIYEKIEKYGYARDQIGFEVKLSKDAVADAIVYREKEKKSPFIVIEFKSRSLYPIESLTLESYMRLSHAEYGVLTNGEEDFSFELVDNQVFKIPDIPRKGRIEKEILLKQELRPKKGLDYSIQKVRDRLEKEGLPDDRIIEEVQKLILSKIEDERSPDDRVRFWISPRELSLFKESSAVRNAFCNRISSLFEKVKKTFPGLFSQTDKLSLDAQTLRYVVTELHDYAMTKMPFESLDDIYQKFAMSTMHRHLGEYFTPKMIARFMIDLLDPGPQETILDPACGTGQFLVASLNHVNNKEEISSAERQEYPQKIFGIDVSHKMVSISRMNMILNGAGHGRIVERDFLSPIEFARNSLPESFDLVVTDPPLSGYVFDKRILQNYLLGKERKKQRVLILFVEKCLRILNSGGRLAMVMPDALLSNDSLYDIRRFMLNQAVMDAIISLPSNILFSDSGLKSSIVIMRKEKRGKKNQNVFMAEIDGEAEGSIGEILRNYLLFKKGNCVLSKRAFIINAFELGRRWDVSFHRTITLDIPENKPLGELCQVLRGLNVSSKWYVSAPHRDLVPYIRISDISDGKIVRKRLKFVAKEASGQSAISSDILFSVRGTIGKTCIITEAFEGSIVSSNIAILRPRKELIYPRFLARVLSSEAVAKQVAQVRRDQFIPYVSLKDLRNIRIPYCPPKKQADILDRIERLEKDFPKNEMKQKDVEEEIRKTLAAVGQ